MGSEYQNITLPENDMEFDESNSNASTVVTKKVQSLVEKLENLPSTASTRPNT